MVQNGIKRYEAALNGVDGINGVKLLNGVNGTNLMVLSYVILIFIRHSILPPSVHYECIHLLKSCGRQGAGERRPPQSGVALPAVAGL